MKKILICILSVIIATSCALFVACDNNKFSAPGFTDFGSRQSWGGFVAQTENYVLFINGIGDSTADNSYGKPVKGSLMAIKKTDFANGDYDKAKIIVPKLFCSSDYTSGLYISNDGYVYYGTPSTDKNSSGNIANDELVFMKSKIDGTEKPTTLLKTSFALSTTYRIVGSGDTAYIVYYDSTDTALKVYTEKDGVQVIAKTDSKTSIKSGDEYLSLNSYTFVEGDKDIAVVYTATVYNEQYYEDKESDTSSYSRSTASYNYFYTYSAGDSVATDSELGGKRLTINDKEKLYTYAITVINNGFVFYTETDVESNASNMFFNLATVSDGKVNAKEQADSDLAADTTLIISENEVYAIDGDNHYVYKTSLANPDTGRIDREQVTMANEDLETLKLKNGDYLYFYNDDNNIVRVKMNDKDANVERVSLGEVSTEWYDPQIVTVGEKDYLLYLDTTKVGSSYVYAANLSSKVIEEDTDDDDEADLYYLESVNALAQKTDSDLANVVIDAVDNIPSTLDLDTDDNGLLYSEEYNKAQKAYDESTVKDSIGSDYVTKLDNCKKAIELVNAYAKLSKIVEYNNMTDEEKAAIKSDYEKAKSIRQALIDESESTYTTVRDLLPEQYKYYYQQAVKKIDSAS